MKRLILYPMILLNVLVLLGLLWPAADPDMARNVHLLFLIASLVYLTVELVSARKKDPEA